LLQEHKMINVFRERMERERALYQRTRPRDPYPAPPREIARPVEPYPRERITTRENGKSVVAEPIPSIPYSRNGEKIIYVQNFIMK
jgi:hypothetical protein